MTRKITVFLNVIAICVAVVPQTEPRLATVEGTVRNLKTGEPIADVRVTLLAEAPPPGATQIPSSAASAKSASTSRDGKFTITAISPGRYAISATRTLFFRPRRDSGFSALTLAEGQRLSGIQILLSPTAVIAGRIADDKRDGLRSVRVEVLRREYRDGKRTWVVAGQSTTDDRGEYRLFNLTPGAYYVRATHSGATPLYYPGSIDSQSAVPVMVEAGGESGGIDFEIRRIPHYSVQLKLQAVPLGGTATFSIRRKAGLADESQTAIPESLLDNTYRLTQLPSGAYEIFVQVYTAAATQPRVLTHTALVPVNVGSSNQDVAVALSQTTPVKGRIIVPDPLPSVLAVDRLVLTLRALDLPAPVSFALRGSTTPPGINADGSFTFPSVAVGRYQVVLSGIPPDTFVFSARDGSREVLDSGYAVTGNQNPLELRVGGPSSVSYITGTVINALGRPVPSSTVLLVPAPERRGNANAFRMTTTDQLGNFSVRSVRDGDYKVLAWEDVDTGLYTDPEFLRDFETRGENIRVRRGTPSATTVRVIPAQ